MASPREIQQARRAPDRWPRTEAMADFVRTREQSGAVTVTDLRQRGFTDAEIFGYADDVRGLISGRPGAGVPSIPPGRAEGLILSEEAKRIRARQDGAAATAHASVAPAAPVAPPAPPPPPPEAASVLREPPKRKPRRFSSADAVLQRLHDLCTSVIADLDEQDLVLVSRAELEARERRLAEADRFRESLSSLLGGQRQGASAGGMA